VIPGICLSLLYMIYIFIRAILNPGLTPRDVDLTAGGRRIKKVIGIVPTFILIGVVMGGLYGGVMTATEAAGIGAMGGVILCFFAMPRDPRALLKAVWEAAREAVSTTCFIMFIVLAAQIFSFAAATSGLMSEMNKFIMALNLSKTTFILLVYLIITIMGCFLEGIAIISLTTPVFFPLLKGFGIDPIWYGVALVVLVELAQVTPPFGINLFVIQGISGNSLTDVIRGTFPFMIIMGIFLFIILAFPQMALWLPSQMHK
jgi:C4-dicarboxylate transporter DctM subunit